MPLCYNRLQRCQPEVDFLQDFVELAELKNYHNKELYWWLHHLIISF